MDGKTFATIIESELSKKGISKGEFYNAIGVTAAAMWGWKKGAIPKDSTVKAVEDYLDIDFSDSEFSSTEDIESIQLREMLRDRQDLRILLHSAKDVPASSVYALISQIEKMKEDAT